MGWVKKDKGRHISLRQQGIGSSKGHTQDSIQEKKNNNMNSCIRILIASATGFLTRGLPRIQIDPKTDTGPYASSECGHQQLDWP